jgi:hypothetical protein
MSRRYQYDANGNLRGYSDRNSNGTIRYYDKHGNYRGKSTSGCLVFFVVIVFLALLKAME